MNDRSVFIPSVTRLNVRYRFHDEIFLHAIGPISFSWKSSLPSIYDLRLPSKNDHFKGLSTVMSTKRSIWNAVKADYEAFATNFNYSSISGVANKAGDSVIEVLMAIEYPDVYKKQMNFFTAKAHIIVSEEIVAPLRKYIDQDEYKMSMIHFIPPNCKHKLITNKDLKMKLHY